MRNVSRPKRSRASHAGVDMSGRAPPAERSIVHGTGRAAVGGARRVRRRSQDVERRLRQDGSRRAPRIARRSRALAVSSTALRLRKRHRSGSRRRRLAPPDAVHADSARERPGAVYLVAVFTSSDGVLRGLGAAVDAEDADGRLRPLLLGERPADDRRQPPPAVLGETTMRQAPSRFSSTVGPSRRISYSHDPRPRAPRCAARTSTTRRSLAQLDQLGRFESACAGTAQGLPTRGTGPRPARPSRTPGGELVARLRGRCRTRGRTGAGLAVVALAAPGGRSSPSGSTPRRAAAAVARDRDDEHREPPAEPADVASRHGPSRRTLTPRRGGRRATREVAGESAPCSCREGTEPCETDRHPSQRAEPALLLRRGAPA